eukprot:5000991-Pleurochrysis_carterae.AAC.1
MKVRKVAIAHLQTTPQPLQRHGYKSRLKRSISNCACNGMSVWLKESFGCRMNKDAQSLRAKGSWCANDGIKRDSALCGGFGSCVCMCVDSNYMRVRAHACMHAFVCFCACLSVDAGAACVRGSVPVRQAPLRCDRVRVHAQLGAWQNTRFSRGVSERVG